METLKEMLIEVLENYHEEKKLPFPGNGKMKTLLVQKLPQLINSFQKKNNSNLTYMGSIGVGQWATVPWVEILDHRKANSVSKGVYVVYLFCADGSGVYLTLNQGTGGISQATVTSEHEVIKNKYLSNYKENIFARGNMPEGSLHGGHNNHARAYEKACILWKYYSLNELKNRETDESLLTDIKNLMRIYQYEDEMVKEKTNYWIFQANPEKRYNVFAALKDGVLKRWLVNAHKGEIKKGDKVILWVTGKYAGIYAVATVDSEVLQMHADEEEKKYYLDTSDFEIRDRVKLKADEILSAPILKAEIDQNVILRNLNVGLQGTNFEATEEQYKEIQSMIKRKEQENNLKTIIERFKLDSFINVLKSTGFQFRNEFIKRFSTSILSKPFVILTGNSGTGKTKLAQLFAQWLVNNNYKLVPVGADWTDNRNVLGFYNPLIQRYNSTPILDLLIEASVKPEEPFFLILDEMNLSHVERYFSDFLSAMESGEKVPLHTETGEIKSSSDKIIPKEIKIPDNLFVIGTVNIDETTYMFSPKVLDRANVLEFAVSEEEIEKYFASEATSNSSIMNAKIETAKDFLKLALSVRNIEPITYEITEPPDIEEIEKVLRETFQILQHRGFEFAYRTINETIRYAKVSYALEKGNWNWKNCADAQIIQKILPKLHGSRRKLEPLLCSLAEYCLSLKIDDSLKSFESSQSKSKNFDLAKVAIFPLSYRKLVKMLNSLREDQFVSFIQQNIELQIL